MISDDLRTKLRLAAALAVTAAACTRKDAVPDAGPADAASSALTTPAEAAADAPADEDASAVAGDDDSGAPDSGVGDAAAEAGRKTAAAAPVEGTIGLIGLGIGDGGLFARDPCPGCGMGGRMDPPGYPDHSAVKGACQLSTTDPKITRARPRFLTCYNTALKSNPLLGGKIVLRLDVAPSGEVSKVDILDSSVQAGSALEGCVRRVAQSLQLDAGTKREVRVLVAFSHDHT